MKVLSTPPDPLSRWPLSGAEHMLLAVLLGAAAHVLLAVPPSWLRGPIARFIPSEA